MENEILAMLKQMNKTQNEQGEVLKEISLTLKGQGETLKGHSEILKEHSEILKEHSEILKEHSEILKEHSEILKEHSETLKNHGESLKEHSLILGALKTGQEVLKAEISELRLQNAKEFGEIKAQLKSHEDSIEILKDESWNNRKMTVRLQKTIGIS
jgi:hypothetical protein